MQTKDIIEGAEYAYRQGSNDTPQKVLVLETGIKFTTPRGFGGYTTSHTNGVAVEILTGWNAGRIETVLPGTILRPWGEQETINNLIAARKAEKEAWKTEVRTEASELISKLNRMTTTNLRDYDFNRVNNRTVTMELDDLRKIVATLELYASATGAGSITRSSRGFKAERSETDGLKG